VAGAEQEPAALPLARGYASDALPARLARVPAVTLTALAPGSLTPTRHHRADDVADALDPAALERVTGFAVRLARALDRDVGRRAGV
jgi:hypothetical protein